MFEELQPLGIDGDTGLLMDALSCFSYDVLGKRMVLCDLQGVERRLSDLQLLEQDCEKWMQSNHSCERNVYCQRMLR